MSVDVIAEVWEVLRMHIDFSERTDAAENLVGYMVENNIDVSDIKTAFHGDKEITTALKIYADNIDDPDDYDDDEDEPY